MILYLYRVFQKRRQPKCLWHGTVPQVELPLIVQQLLTDYLIVPCQPFSIAFVAEQLSQLQWFEASRMVEMYLHSAYSSNIPELGLGLAINRQKWTSQWPQYQWEALKQDPVIPGAWRGIEGPDTKWTLSQLTIQRRRKAKKPIGCPQQLWHDLASSRADFDRVKHKGAGLLPKIPNKFAT